VVASLPDRSTSDWWLGHDVLVAPSWIDNIRWLESTVSVGVTRRAIQDAPHHDAENLPTRAQEHSRCMNITIARTTGTRPTR